MTPKPLSDCCNEYAVPPSPLMLKHGNDYYTCSKCGKTCNPITPKSVELEDSELRTAILKFDRSRGNISISYVLDKITREQADVAFEKDIATLLAVIHAREERLVREAEDKALKYASSVYALFKDRDEGQQRYAIKLLRGDTYRKEHKDVKIVLREQKGE